MVLRIPQWYVGLAGCLSLVFALGALAQKAQSVLGVPQTTADVLADMASHATVIFAGRVESVSRADSAGFVDVRFRIEEAVRGCSRIGVYVLREWSGLWAGREDRYRPGQHLLMLLAGRGPGGLSAPVYSGSGSIDGAIPIIAASTTDPSTSPIGPLSVDDGAGASQGLVDLRWLEAHSAAFPAHAASSPAGTSRPNLTRTTAPAVRSRVPTQSRARVHAAASASAAAPSETQADLTSILAMLRGSVGGLAHGSQ